MSQVLNLDPAQLGILLGMLAVAGGVVIRVTTAVASQWRHVREAEIDAALKAQMLDQGMTAEEIDRVLNSGRAREPESNASFGHRHKHRCC